MTTEPTKPKPRRRWLQYSLRTFFVLLTVFGVWLGWMTYEAREQGQAVAWVRRMGGTVGYDYQSSDDGHVLDDGEPSGPKWLRELLGPDFFNEVVGVNLENTPVSDLRPLENLTNLRWLWFPSTQAQDLTSLEKLTNLRYLFLGNMPVSEEHVNHLRKALPNCNIIWTPPNPSP